MSEEAVCDPCTEPSVEDLCKKIGIISVGKYAAVADRNKDVRYIPNKKDSLYHNDGNNPDWKNGSEDEKLLLPSLRQRTVLNSVIGLEQSAIAQIKPDTSLEGAQVLAYYNGDLKFHPDGFREACFPAGQILDKNCGSIALLKDGPDGGLCLVRFTGCEPGSKTIRALLVDGDGKVSCGTISAEDVLPSGPSACQVLSRNADNNGEEWIDINKTMVPLDTHPQVASGSGAIDAEKTVPITITLPSPPANATHTFLRAHLFVRSSGTSLTEVFGEITINGHFLVRASAVEHAVGYNSSAPGDSVGSGLFLNDSITAQLEVGRPGFLTSPGTGHSYSFTIWADYYAVDHCVPA